MTDGRGFGHRMANPPSTWISKTPGVCGGRACVRDTRITVWGLVASKREGLNDTDLIEQIQGLRTDDLQIAWNYASNHPSEVDTSICENEDA